MLRVLIVGEAKGQPVVGLDVQLPHQVFLPRRENLGVDRLHVGIGQQTQHTQVVGIPHEIGELIDHMLVAEIAPHNDFRHLQMMFDDEHHLVCLILWQFQLPKDGCHALCAGMNMIAFVVAVGFADVMKEQRKQKQFGVVQFVQQDRESVVRGQFFYVADRYKRMLVDRVFMEEVPDDPATNLLEIGKDLSQQTYLVHCQQRVIDALPVLHHFQDGAPCPGVVAKDAIGVCEAAADRDERRRVQPGLLPVGFAKSRDHFKRIRELRRDTDHVWMANDFLFPEASLARQHSGFQEVIPHQVFCRFTTLRIPVP